MFLTHPTLIAPIVSTLDAHCANSNLQTVSSIPENRVALVDGVSVQFPDPYFVDSVNASASSAGYALDYYSSHASTLDLFMNLPRMNYRLIILRTHGGFYGPMTTTEPYTDQGHVVSQLLDEVGAIDVNGTVYFSITPKGITDYLCGQFPGTVILGMGCGSASNLASQGNAFVKKGAGALIAWDTWVGIYHSDLAYEVVIQNLLEHNTIAGSVQAGMSKIGPDPNFGSSLAYFPETESQLKL